MKKTTWLEYFFIITLLLLVVFSGDFVFDGIIEKANSTFKIPKYLYISEIGFFVSIGLLLGLEYFIKEMKKVGKWKINLPKILLLGIPSLYFSFGIYIYFGMGNFLPNVLTSPIAMLMNKSNNFMVVFQLILGHTIITIFYKKDGRT
ncbi:MAG: hypothetical protein K0R18_1891 [Bacillales bacterium]|jgi:hypothetical protein|nr:hypothetical protein [Bacillales bacterium]